MHQPDIPGNRRSRDNHIETPPRQPVHPGLRRFVSAYRRRWRIWNQSHDLPRNHRDCRIDRPYMAALPQVSKPGLLNPRAVIFRAGTPQ